MPSGGMIHAVLLVPADGDPHGLLREGPCGARPPTVVDYGTGDGPNWRRWLPSISGWGSPPAALVLAWDGKPVPEGLFRAWWYADDVLYREDDWPDGTLGLDDVLHGALVDIVDAVGSWRHDGEPLGALVILDADGQEVLPRTD